MGKPKILEIQEKINNMNTYSTEEVKTGGIWINGKPIYRKVVSTSINNFTGEKTIELNTANVDIFINGRVLLDTANLTAIDTAGSSTSYYVRKWVYRKTNNTVMVTTNMTDLTGTIYVVVEYTKTTD